MLVTVFSTSRNIVNPVLLYGNTPYLKVFTELLSISLALMNVTCCPLKLQHQGKTHPICPKFVRWEERGRKFKWLKARHMCKLLPLRTDLKETAKSRHKALLELFPRSSWFLTDKACLVEEYMQPYNQFGLRQKENLSDYAKSDFTSETLVLVFNGMRPQ